MGSRRLDDRFNAMLYGLIARSLQRCDWLVGSHGLVGGGFNVVIGWWVPIDLLIGRYNVGG